MLYRISLQPANLNPAGLIKRLERGLAWAKTTVRILYPFAAGILLLCLPWMGIWENNYLLYQYPQLQPVVTNSYFKGAVLGLGISDLLIGIQDVRNIRKIFRSHLAR